ncbi:hypothetical protein MHU86_12292 [Fragilaria crotonensis]|nr:hypothetical protein MHU86_12292 [Fragilaria crotonensis]
MFYAAFSPDAIAVAENENIFGEDEGIPFIVEIKSKCTPATVMKETALARTYGTCPTIYVVMTDPPTNDDFKRMIPEPEYRCQLLHGIACGNLRHAFYVVASLHKIIRVVHVNVDEQVVEQYRCALQEVHDRELSWVLHGRLPCLGGMKLRHAVDEYTVQNTLELWRAIYNLVKTRGRPLPAGRMLIPTIVAMWNRSKGPVDVFSRYMKNCHARHAQLSPLAHIWLRLLMSRVYNAYQSYILSRSVAFLLSDGCNLYAAFQAHRKLYGSFSKFCSSLAKDLTLEVSGDDSSDSEGGDDGGISIQQTGEGSVLNTSGRSFTYNKRELYFTSREMIQRRLDQSLPHVLCKVESKPTSCVWCCRKRHDQPDPKHCRHGRTTKFMCPVCMVSLCRVKRFNGMSCHELFHTSRSLVDYCTAEMDAVVHVIRIETDHHLRIEVQ